MTDLVCWSQGWGCSRSCQGTQRHGMQVWDTAGSSSLCLTLSRQTYRSPAPPAGTCLRVLMLINVTPLMTATRQAMGPSRSGEVQGCS